MIRRKTSSGTRAFPVWIAVILVAATCATAGTPPEEHYVLRAAGGALNGVPIDAARYEVTVAPGEAIAGSVVVQTVNSMPPTSVAPLGGTVDWGDRETQPWLTDGWIASGTATYTVDVNKVAPMTPGEYHIIVAFGGEFTIAQVMSATNWATFPDHHAVWHDGNDLGFDWDETQIAAALFDGIVPMLQLTANGYVDGWRAATAVVVHVTDDCNGNGVPDDQDILDGTSADCDGNDRPDECQPDGDADGVIDVCDNCPGAWNPGQDDSDADGLGDACDNAPPEPRGWRRYNYNWDNTRFYPYATVGQLAFSELSVRWSRPGSSVVTGNVDADDPLEIAVISDTTLSVLESNGATAWSTTLPYIGAAIVLDDVDADEKLDVLVSVKASPDTHEIRAYRGYDGELLKTLVLPVEGNEGFLLYGAVDLDDDGDLELLTALKSGYGLYRRGVWVFDYATGSEAWHYEIGPQLEDAVVADTDGDGIQEIMLGQAAFHNGNSANGFPDSSAWLFVFNGTGGLRCAASLGNWVVGPSRADIDQDGDEEVVALRGGDFYGGSLAACEVATSDCSIPTCWPGPVDVDPLGRAIGDVRQEPGLEIVIGGKDQVRIIGADFALLEGRSLDPQPQYVRAIGDVDGDGNNEIYVIAGPNLYVVDGDLNVLWSRSFADTISNVILSDLDMDGAIDVLVTEGGMVHVLASRDCNSNGIPDDQDIANCDGSGWCADCNDNGVPDECDLAAGVARDCNGNNVLDSCEIESCSPEDVTCQDCNLNLSPDACDITDGISNDVNTNGIPDECEADCNGNGIPDTEDIAGGVSQDCHTEGQVGYGIPDECDIDSGTSEDCNEDGVPDECTSPDGVVASSWSQPASGDWNSPSLWCPEEVPNNDIDGRYAVTIGRVNGIDVFVTLNISPTLSALSIENGATVETNVGSGLVRALFVETPIMNAGTLRATDGTRLLIDSSDIEQTADGLIEAVGVGNEESKVEINGSRVVGGRLRTNGPNAVIELLGGATLEDVTIEGDPEGVQQQAAATLLVPERQTGILGNAVANSGVIAVGKATEPLESSFLLVSAGGATLSGPGRVVLRNELATFGDFLHSITNGPQHSIRGAGRLYGDLVNEAQGDAGVVADVPGQRLTISPPGAKTNNGVFRATNGGILEIADSVSGTGALLADAGGTIEMQNVNVATGRLTAKGGTVRIEEGTVQVEDDVDVLPGSLGNLYIVSSTLYGTKNLRITGGRVYIHLGSDVDFDRTIRICADTNAAPDAVAELEIADSSATASDLVICHDGKLAVQGVGPSISLAGSFSFAVTNEADWSWGASSRLEMTGGSGLPHENPALYAQLEVGGRDLGTDPANRVGSGVGFEANFELRELVIGSAAHVTLVDNSDNGNRGDNGFGRNEALYVHRLVLSDTESRLNLNGLHLYYEELSGDASQIVDLFPGWYDFDIDGNVDLRDFGAMQACFGAATMEHACRVFDFVDDGTIDLADLEALQSYFHGP